MTNLELKAAAPDLSRLRTALRSLGASREAGPLEQVDWYFTVSRGRLKLRRQAGERGGELIFYIRPDASRARTSEYQKLPTADAAALLRLLRMMFAPDACVRKQRDLWLLGETRVHLDRVKGLGNYVEIEVPFDRDIKEARRTMRQLADALGIARADLLPCSYADLLVRSEGGTRRQRRAGSKMA